MGIENIKKEDNKKRVVISIVKILILLLIVVGIPLYIYFCQRDFLTPLKTWMISLPF